MTLHPDFLRAVSAQFPADFLSLDPQVLDTYGRDWTRHFEVRPGAVVFPRSTEDVSHFLRLCLQHRVPVVPSGGRTGLSGGAVASRGEAVLSLERMNRIDPVELKALTVRVQAGAVTEAVHRHCEQHGYTWPIDLAAKGSSQVGGNLSTNAGGIRVIRYGPTRNWVSGLQVVLMDGTVLELNGGLQKNVTGLDLCQLFIGTEGTLGVITEATLRLAPLPRHSELFFFAVSDFGKALELLTHARLNCRFPLLAFEYLDHGCLESVLRLGQTYASPFAAPAPCYTLVEFECPDSTAAREALETWLEQVLARELVSDGALAQSSRDRRAFWALREHIAEGLNSRGLMYMDDVAVPVPSLASFLEDLHRVYHETVPELELFVFGHLGDGNLHLTLVKPPEMEPERFTCLCRRADDALYGLVGSYRGSISAEHGVGLMKKKALPHSRTPEELELFRRVKRAFDPENLLNPGKIFDLELQGRR